MRRPSVSRDELAYYRAHFLEALREDGVVCLECGTIVRSLPQHVPLHDLRGAAYRARWGYNRHTCPCRKLHPACNSLHFG